MQPFLSCSRRNFLKSMALGGMSGMTGITLRSYGDASEPSLSSPASSLIADIGRETIFPGRQTGSTWFQARACMIPADQGKEGWQAIMTMQKVFGSDFYGPVHETLSRDFGKTWGEPKPIPPFGRIPWKDGIEEGTCDVVPEHHPRTRTVLAMGFSGYYTTNAEYPDAKQPPRKAVYAVRSEDGQWSDRKVLEWDDCRNARVAGCGCSQRIMLADGDVLLPGSWTQKKTRVFASVRCGYDGKSLSVKQVSKPLRLDVKRGLLEPSLVQWKSDFLVTLRAEDGRGYVSASHDGMAWSAIRPWAWEDGQPLAMSTTQQHWLAHSDGLFLVYTRKDASNLNLFRYRAPLYVAEVNPRTLRLVKHSERIVLPLIGDGLQRPNTAAGLGNFHVTAASPRESWITAAEERPEQVMHGDTLLARIRWTRPNRLAHVSHNGGADIPVCR
jgi:hypothetical protein